MLIILLFVLLNSKKLGKDYRNPMMLNIGLLMTLGFSLLAFTGYGFGFWTAPFFIRVHGVDEANAGLVLGGTAAAAGWRSGTSRPTSVSRRTSAR